MLGLKSIPCKLKGPLESECFFKHTSNPTTANAKITLADRCKFWPFEENRAHSNSKSKSESKKILFIVGTL